MIAVAFGDTLLFAHAVCLCQLYIHSNIFGCHNHLHFVHWFEGGGGKRMKETSMAKKRATPTIWASFSAWHEICDIMFARYTIIEGQTNWTNTHAEEHTRNEERWRKQCLCNICYINSIENMRPKCSEYVCSYKWKLFSYFPFSQFLRSLATIQFIVNWMGFFSAIHSLSLLLPFQAWSIWTNIETSRRRHHHKHPTKYFRRA